MFAISDMATDVDVGASVDWMMPTGPNADTPLSDGGNTGVVISTYPAVAPAPVVPNTGVVTGGRSVYGGAGAVIVQTGAGSAPPVVDTAHTGLVTSVPTITAPPATAHDVSVSSAPGVVTGAPGGAVSTVALGQPSPVQLALIAAALLAIYYVAK